MMMWNLEVTWMTSNQITIALTKGRIEKDTVKLERLYEEGFTLGEAFCKEFI